MRKQLTYLVGMLCLFYNCMAQDYTISGKVTDSKDRSPLPGVTVRILGTKSATVTQLDGGFTLKANSEKPKLEISYVGYTTQTVTASANSPVTVLDVEPISMSEVVVNGVGVATKKETCLCRGIN